MAVGLTFFIAFFASLFGILYLFFTTRNKERMAMIEKGVDPALFATGREPRKGRSAGSGLKFSLKTGMFIIGIGVGFVISVLFNEVGIEHDIYPLLVIGIIFICGGAGLVSGYYMGRNLDKKDSKE